MWRSQKGRIMATSIGAKAPAARWRRGLLSSFILATLCALASTASATPTPSFVQKPEGLPELMIFPPKDASVARPVVVMLHGMCDEPVNECPLVADAFTERAWLVCPRGDTPCNGGGATWSWAKRAKIPDQVIEHMRVSFGARIDETAGHTLAGFSLGALAAVDAFQGGSASFRHLILIGAKVEPAVAWLRDARIKDVVLMAGQWDMMYQHMLRKARTLERSGVVARFFDLGPVGHQFPADINQRLRNALTWTDI